MEMGGCCLIASPAMPTKSLWELLLSGDTSSWGDLLRMRFFRLECERVCLNLALSLLHLSTCPWKRVYWGSDGKASEGIFFLRDPVTGSIVDRTHSYLSYRLLYESDSLLKHDSSLSCDPRLLEFAKIIMEIRMWETIPLEGKRDILVKNQLRLKLLELINDTNIFSKKDAMFKKAIEACLSAEGKGAALDEEDDGRLRNFIVTKIVRPLDHYALFPEFSTPAQAAENHMRKLDEMFDWREAYAITPDER